MESFQAKQPWSRTSPKFIRWVREARGIKSGTESKAIDIGHCAASEEENRCMEHMKSPEQKVKIVDQSPDVFSVQRPLSAKAFLRHDLPHTIYIYMSAITWYVYTNIHFYCFEEKFQHLSSRKVLTSDLQCKHFPKVAWFWYDLHVPKLNTGLQIMLVLEGYQAQQARCAESIEP